METLTSLEKTLSKWYKDLPHLPKGFTDWLAENIWWLVVIGVVLSILSLLVLIPVALIVFGITSGVASTYGYPGAMSVTGAGLAWLSVTLSIAALVVTTILEAMAISPLKAKAKKGWTLLFAVAVFNLAFNIVSALVEINIFGIITAILWAAVWGYFLFEIRSYFGAKHKAEAKTAKKA